MPTHLHRSAQVDAQLSGMAASRDTANQPRMLVVLSAVLLAAALIFLMVGARKVSSARHSLANAQSYATRIDGLLNQIDTKKSSKVDFTKLYPKQPYLQVFTQDLVDKGSYEFTNKPSVSSPREILVLRDAGVYQLTIQCRIQQESLDKILKWIDDILRLKQLRGQAFLSHITLTPQGSGWQSSFDISVYTTK